MSASPSLSGVATALAPAPAPAKPRARGFLHIVRYGAGPGSVYVLTYHRLERTSPLGGGEPTNGSAGAASVSTSSDVILSVAKDLSSSDRAEPDARPKPVVAEDAQALLDLLERIGVNFKLAEVRGALEDILRLGSANIPDLWLSDEDLLAKGLAES